MNPRDWSRQDLVLRFFLRQENAGQKPDCCISRCIHSRWAQLCLFSLPLSFLLSRSLSFLFLSVTAFLFQTHETTLYLHTSTNPESFRVPCFSIARVHAGLASADFRLPASGSFLSFCSSLSFSLWYARNINGHLCSRLTVDNFFLFCRWILCLLCFFSYFSFEINHPSSVSI